jgi:hypothetical protein
LEAREVVDEHGPTERLRAVDFCDERGARECATTRREVEIELFDAMDRPAPRNGLCARRGLVDRSPAGYPTGVEVVSTVESVQQVETRGGNVRYVVRDADGNEYTTFREAIGSKAVQLEGQRTRIEYHTEKRGQYTNVYLDSIVPVPGSTPADHGDTDPEEVAWRTAVDAAPWLLGEADPQEKTSPAKLYQTLRPFKEKVAEDIKQGEDQSGSSRDRRGRRDS